MQYDFWKKPNNANQFVTQINRESSHVFLGGYESAEQARKREASANTFSLDGTWDFILFDKLEDIPDSALQSEKATLKWKDITVPGNWEIQGFAPPIFTNKVYPFQKDDDTGYQEGYLIPAHKDGRRDDVSFFEQFNPPAVPTDNAVGLYRRSFMLPKSPKDKDVFLHFDGVEAAYYLWVNGQPVGYSEDSKLPSEFDVTPYVQEGENIVTVAVLRFCGGTWLEGQDYYHLSGIYRSVRVLMKPKRCIRDMMVDASLNPDLTTGDITARCFVRRAPYYADCRIKMALYDHGGKQLAECERPIDTMAPISGLGTRLNEKYMRPLPESAKFKIPVQDIVPWSCDKPVLYTVVFTLLDEAGEGIDFESCRVGFRRIALDNNIITLNFKRFIFRGANRHDHYYLTGRTLTREHMKKEILLMKEYNFNSVRASHYPNDPVFYDLCDEYGLCVVCESNLETHALMGALTNHPEWSESMLERGRRMVMTHKNHPSIVSWSLGNESGYGPGHAAMANWIREYDPTRMVQYENNDPGSIASDIKCTMYPPVPRILTMVADNVDRRPIVSVEYTYQISNSGGGLYQFNELAETYELFQGGFVWDWQDKCVIAKDVEGNPFPGYSGDFQEDYVEWICPVYMCANGMVFSDLSPKPVCLEMKIAHAPVAFKMSTDASGWFLLRNRYNAISSDEMEYLYEVVVDGEIKEQGKVAFTPVDRTDYADITGRFKTSSHKELLDFQDEDNLFRLDFSKWTTGNRDVDVTLKAVLNLELPWAKKGFEVTSQQFKIKRRALQLAKKPVGVGQLKVSREGSLLTVEGANFTVAFDMEKNLLMRYEKNGEAYLLPSGKEIFRRARSGLHLGSCWWGRCEQHWNALPEGKETPVSAQYLMAPAADRVEVVFQNIYKGEKGSVLGERRIAVLGDGSLYVEAAFHIDAALETVPRLGVEWVLPKGFEQINWYGRGPGESYCDRNLSTPIGYFETTVEDTHLPFVPPSHCGTRADTRSVTFKNEAGRKITVSGAPFYFTAHHNTVEDYWNAAHDHELKRRDEIYLHIDGFHTGIGGNMAWSTEIEDQHLIMAGHHRFGFTVTME